MSDAPDREDKTEEASPARLEQRRKEGEIPLGRDVAALGSLAIGGLGLWLVGKTLATSLTGFMRESAVALPSDLSFRPGFALYPVIGLALLVCFAGLLGGAGIFAAQTRGQIWGKRLSPDFKRTFQLERITRMVKREFFVDVAVSGVKVLAIGGALYLAASDDFVTLPALLSHPIDSIFAELAALLGKGLAGVLVVLAGLSALDYALQRSRFMEKSKMTREEVKRERKDEEGDPHVRQARKRKHRQMTKGRLVEEVQAADVVVVNPTHIAIVLRYDKEKDPAPRVVAKGKADRADKIREIARENSIPIVRDVPLARLLHKQVKVGGVVPAETYRAVAAVLRFVYRTRGKR